MKKRVIIVVLMLLLGAGQAIQASQYVAQLITMKQPDWRRLENDGAYRLQLQLEYYAKKIFSPVTIPLLLVTIGAEFAGYKAQEQIEKGIGWAKEKISDIKISLAEKAVVTSAQALIKAAQEGNFDAAKKALSPLILTVEKYESALKANPNDSDIAWKKLSFNEKYLLQNAIAILTRNKNEAFRAAIDGAAINDQMQAAYWKIANLLIEQYRQNLVPLDIKLLLTAIEKNQPVIAQKMLVGAKLYLLPTDIQKVFDNLIAMAEKTPATKGSTKSSYLNLLKAFLEKLEPGTAKKLITSSTTTDTAVSKIFEPYKK